MDTHVHYPQTQMIGAYGEQLLDWLTNYTFPVEQSFANYEHASEIANFFLDQQLCNGVTTSLVYSTVHQHSADALFTAAQERNMRLITGKVRMDRNAPEKLLDTPERAFTESEELIQRWHGTGRLSYAITPRFAPTSTPEQLAALGELAAEYPDTFIQTHLSENTAEVEWVHSLFPERSGYLDVYDHYGLVRERSVFGHCIHLTDEEYEVLHERDASIAHCPTSNFFLGSGYFDIATATHADRPVRVGIGTDLGAGTSFSILNTLNEAYKAAQLNHHPLSAIRALYTATAGSANALHLDHTIGHLRPGFEADMVVLGLKSTTLIDYRMKYADSLEEALFIQMILGDDRAIAATYVAGQQI